MKTKHERHYLARLQKRYQQASKPQKIIILDEFTKTTGYDRKHAGKLLRKKYRHKTGRIHRPRRRIYTRQDRAVLIQVWKLLGFICAKRMKPELRVAIHQLMKAGKLFLTKEDRKRVIGISPATMDRLLTGYKRRYRIKGRSYTKPGTLLKTQIPIRTFSEWNQSKVGFAEVDLVGHDGGNSRGDFAHTLNFTDVKTQWTEQVAVRNKAQIHVFAGIKRVRDRLPFSLLGIDSDSGSEFINDQLYRYCIQEKITFTRGRPGHKNDNPHVEQKNDSVVRNWVGYGRFDTQPQVDQLNKLYELLRLYTNFFLPVMKLKKKIRVGSRIKKMHDRPTTPYHRILRAKDVSKDVKNNLKKTYKTLNLVVLKQQIDTVLKGLKPTPVR